MERTNRARGAWRGAVAAFASAAVALTLVAAAPAAASATEAAASDDAAVDTMADRVFVDDAGREVTIPGVDALTSIFPTGAISEIYCFSLVPEKFAGTTMEYTEQELHYLPAEFADLEYLGTLSGGKELNFESIIAAAPQLIVDVTQSGITDSSISTADEIQEKTGIPVVVLNGDIDQIDQLYTRLGELFGCEELAAELGQYCVDARASVEEAVATVPEDERVTVYYAEGNEGLQTEPSTSVHALAFNIAGADLVADVEAKSGKGMSDVSLEQVLAWDPEVIIAWSTEVRGGASETIVTDPNWSSIQAVQDGRVYTMPNTPFSWLDRPPSVNRFLGMQWLAATLYPEAYDVDMVEVVKEFYQLFYRVELTDEEAMDLLGNSYTPAETDQKAAA